MQFTILGIVLAGLLGALVMGLWMSVGNAFGIERHHPGSYLGTLLFGVTRRAFVVGLVVHFCLGVIVAAIYAALMTSLRLPGGFLWGLLFGFVHWLVVMGLYGVLGPLHPAVRAGRVLNPGFFAAREGWVEPANSLIDHLLFGAVAGETLGFYRAGSGMSVPYSFSSWSQPSTSSPSIAWVVLVVLAVIAYIVFAALGTRLGGADELFVGGEPSRDEGWMLEDLLEKRNAGLISDDEYERRMRDLR